MRSTPVEVGGPVLTRGPLRIAGFRVVGSFPGIAGAASARVGVATSLLPRARASRAEALDARRVPASSAIGGAFRSHSARCRAPSTESQRTPLRRHAHRCPHPRARARFGKSPPGDLHVPPTPFLPASTVSSTDGSAGLLHPAADPGVHRVAAPRDRVPAIRSALSLRCPPFRAFPSREAWPTSPWTSAPLPLAGNASGSTPRPSSARESVATWTRGRVASLDALLGFPT